MRRSLSLPDQYSTGSTIIKLTMLSSLLVGSMWVIGMMLAFAFQSL